MVGPVRVSQSFGASDIPKKMKKNYFLRKSDLMTIPALTNEDCNDEKLINELIFYGGDNINDVHVANDIKGLFGI